MASVYDEIKRVMDSYGIPESIWLPIAKNESGLNPAALAVSSKESSKGIFQINTLAHPEYADVDLYNPATNAMIAARDFIGPAYSYAQGVTDDPRQQALIVYSGLKDPQAGPSGGYIPGGAGIRPKWTTATMDRFLSNYDSVVHSGGGVSFDGSRSTIGSTSGKGGGGITFGGVQKSLSDYNAGTLTGWQPVVKFLILLGLAIVSAVALFSLFKDTAPVKIITKGATAAATGGASLLTEGD